MVFLIPPCEAEVCFGLCQCARWTLRESGSLLSRTTGRKVALAKAGSGKAKRHCLRLLYLSLEQSTNVYTGASAHGNSQSVADALL